MQGKTINGYTLQRPLGTGGMAEVWYAENKIHKPAAIKILNADLAHNASIEERFRNEAEVMVKLSHPNIRQVYDYGDIDGRPAIIMEYLDGEDLKSRIKRGQHFTQEELERWWNQLVDALNYTHAQGIIHRDIKPGNIFVDKEGNIKLLDFGIAKVRESISSTQTGQKLGTLMYMSPEQVKDSKHIDYRTDVYSLAVTFVHIITGKKPYDSDTSSDFEISEQIVYRPMDMSGVPPVWQNFLMPYLEKDPQQRAALRSFSATPAFVTENPKVGDDETCIDAPTISKPEPAETVIATPGVETPRPAPKQETPRQEKPKPVEPKQDKPKKKRGWLWILLGLIAAGVALFFVFDPFGDRRDALFPFSDDEGKIGFMDKSGKTIIEPKYDGFRMDESVNNPARYMRVFCDGLAAVRIEDEDEDEDEVDDKWGYINRKGEMVISAKYDDAQAFSEGMAAVGIYDEDEGTIKCSYINKKGEMVISERYDRAYPFSDGLALVMNYDEDREATYYYIDKKGEKVIKPKVDVAAPFSDGLAVVGIGEDWNDREYGYIDKKGNYVIQPKYHDVGLFSEGLAPVEVDDEWGFIDKKGNMVISPEYEQARMFTEGLAAVRDEDGWGFIDKKGNVVIKCKYEEVRPFSDGLAAVLEDEKYGFIDKKGNMVISPKYEFVYSFWNGVAYVYADDEASYIDKKGNVIKSFETK